MLFAISLLLMHTRIDPRIPESEIRHTTDLAAFVGASRALSNHVDLYDPAVTRTMVPESDVAVLPYVYSPIVAQILLPFNSASIATIQRWWIIVGAALMAAFVVLLLSYVQQNSVVMAIAFMLGLPIHFALVNGQIEPFIAVVVVGSIIAYLRGYPAVAGLLLGSALVIKHAFVLFLLWFVLERSWRTLLFTVGTSLFWVGVSVLVSGIDVWLSFVTFTRSMNFEVAMQYGITPSVGYDLSVTSMLIRAGLPPQIVFGSAGFVFFAAVMIATAWKWNRGELDRMQTMTIVSLAAVLALPYMWSHHLLYCGLSFAVICTPAMREITTSRKILIVVAVLALQIAPGMPIDRLMGWMHLGVQVEYLGTAASLLTISTLLLSFRTPLLRST